MKHPQTKKIKLLKTKVGRKWGNVMDLNLRVKLHYIYHQIDILIESIHRYIYLSDEDWREAIWLILVHYTYIYIYEKMNTIVLVFVCIAAIIGLNFILGLILMCCFAGMFAVVVPKLSDLNEQNPVWRNLRISTCSASSCPNPNGFI